MSETVAQTIQINALQKLAISWAIFLCLGMRRCVGMLFMAGSQACAPPILQMLIASARATRRLRRVVRLLGTFPLLYIRLASTWRGSKCRQLNASWTKSEGVPSVRSGSKRRASAGTFSYKSRAWRKSDGQNMGGENRTIPTMGCLKSHALECSVLQ